MARIADLLPADMVTALDEQRAPVLDRRAFLRLRKEHRSEYINRYKAQKGCRDCGERDPALLTFHHLDPAQKVKNVSQLKGVALIMLLREMAKCEILCEACHKKEHGR